MLWTGQELSTATESQKRVPQIFNITCQVLSRHGGYWYILIGKRKHIPAPLKFRESEASRFQVGVNTVDLNIRHKVLDSPSYVVHNSKMTGNWNAISPGGRISQGARNRNTICHVPIPGKRFSGIHSGIQRMKCRPCHKRKGQKSSTAILDAAAEQLGIIFMPIFPRCISSIAFTHANRKLDDLVWDPGVRIHSMVKINIALDNETVYPVLWGKDAQSDAVSRTNELMVWITQRDDQHHQYHSCCGNCLPATTDTDYPCYHWTIKLPCIRVTSKRHSGAFCIGRHLFLKVSEEMYQLQGYDSPYHSASSSALNILDICSAIIGVGNQNLTTSVRPPGKWLHDVCRRSQRMKRRSHSAQKSWRIRTRFNPDWLVMINIRIYRYTASRWELVATFVRHHPRFTLADVYRALRDFRILMVPMIICIHPYLISMPENMAKYLRWILHSSQSKVHCQLILESAGFPGFAVYSCLKMREEVSVIKFASKQSFTDHPHSVGFNTTSSKANLLENSEHDELNQNLRLINSPNDIPEDSLAILITTVLRPDQFKRRSLGISGTVQARRTDGLNSEGESSDERINKTAK
ncbi:hypothetical protein IW261DRAFT_1427060 [Armillaria novae-zelandiae]|uniref:Uncharacterized protein n=1 Tax=Armillaria novae-zelandiae TaxID=153914 RepID=A0AA39NHL5_9AGAR|nr:hypothetical protein IW261DRAFT_1427060 [Armillaria novae-zelandiae]